ncbi:hypothetical protein B0H14DRAFT_2685785 [Mycena olivaceomarginata]|nr:hypothetical protein B0H14DRAFT_2685785 [Mycena olivaceomarginata]
MHSDGSTVAPKKRKRSESPDGAPERERTYPGNTCRVSSSSVEHPDRRVRLCPVRRGSGFEAPSGPTNIAEEDWNWELTTEQIARLSEEELTIWKDLLPCRHNLRLSLSFLADFSFSGIKLHPFNWKMPVVDLRQWQAHIPGLKNTPWEGGSAFLNHFSIRMCIPAVPGDTWSVCPEVKVTERRIPEPEVWRKTKQEDPERFAKLLRSIQKLIHEPDLFNPHSGPAYEAAKNNPKGYEKQDPCTGLAGRPILHA